MFFLSGVSYAVVPVAGLMSELVSVVTPAAATLVTLSSEIDQTEPLLIK